MPSSLSIDSVLIANRGEIAVRIARTCRRLGVRTVALHTDEDRAAPHVAAADAAVHVASYLDVDAVVAAAVASGAAAVHPGYGFLSERAELARAVASAGLVFVGPTAEVIEQMGRKDHARDIAVSAGVPVVPTGDDAGFPVLVKAAAGGGGKGMRVVRSAAELDDAVTAARSEAAASFGDDAVLLERFVERGRHLEVQVLADHHDHVLHLFERDCSVQRRHQKVIEEAPAPGIDAALRARLTTAAVDLARSVGYTGAGTVEFLLDVDSGEFFFLEMNTRLQVEHPITEAVTGGLDLVELQLRVATGEPLTLQQDDLRLHGHAIEARVYAEDAEAGFLPQAGTATIVRWPAAARVDHALEPGQRVSTSYDPMLGKVVVHAPDREAARIALVAALDGTVIAGLTTNTGFLRDLAASDAFASAAIDTAWLDRTALAPVDPDPARAVAAWADAQTSNPGPGRADGWRSAAAPRPTRVRLDRDVEVDLARRTVDGVPLVEHDVDSATVLRDDTCVEVVLRGRRQVFARPDGVVDRDVEIGDGAVTAPMPGTVVDVRVREGESVVAGQVLGTLEAMKMQLSLTAAIDGTVAEVVVAPGQQVAMGSELFRVETVRVEQG